MLICQKVMVKTANANDKNAPGYIVFYCRINDEYYPVLPSLLQNHDLICSHCKHRKGDKDNDITRTDRFN